MKLGSIFTAPSSEINDAVCPGCGQKIPLEDINVAKDLALCRACGKTWTFSLAATAKELKNVDTANPPKGIRIETDFEGATKITYKRISPIAFFLVIFTAFWGGGSMIGIYGSQIRKGEFKLTDSLFGIPFLLGTIVLCSVTAFLLFGRWEIRIWRNEGTVFVGVGPFGWRRRFVCDPGTRVSLEMTAVQINNRSQEAIVVQRGDQKVISFGTGIANREAKVFIAASLARTIS